MAINLLNQYKQKRVDECDPEYENPDDYTVSGLAIGCCFVFGFVFFFFISST
jgi:hypothetical protein